MKKLIGMLAICVAATCSSVVGAHGSPSPSHGGIVLAVGETWLELVVHASAIDLYVEDDGEPLDSAKISGKLTVATATGKTDYVLVPAGTNKLEAKGASAAKGAKVMAVLVLSDKTKVPATFLIK